MAKTTASEGTATVEQFSLVQVAASDIPVTARTGKYVRLVERFVTSTEAGDITELLNADGSPLGDEKVAHRAYYGIRHFLKYRKEQGIDIPVRVSKHNSRVFLEHTK